MQTCFFWPTHSVDLEFWIYTEKDVDENPGMTEYGRNDEWRRLLTTAQQARTIAGIEKDGIMIH